MTTESRSGYNGLGVDEGNRADRMQETTITKEPLISVITVVRNGRDVIERTILSVLGQRYGHLEYIVIDGGSTDGTVDIIRKYTDRISCWVSEPDAGIYDAMNKALDRARGEGHLFINAGDYLIGEALPPMLTLPSLIPVRSKNVLGRIRPAGRKDSRQGLPYCHQGIIFESKGIRFDTTYRYAADYLYYLQHGYGDKLPLAPVSGHVYHDAGFSKVNARGRDQEIASIIHERFGMPWYLLFRAKVIGKNAVRSVLRVTGVGA